jgi:hypothetical protein
MKEDPTISRIRKVRREISRRFGHDTGRLVKYYIDRERDKGKGGRARSERGATASR